MKNWRTTLSKWSPWLFGFALLLLWELASRWGWLPAFIIPAPSEIIQALVDDWQNLLYHSRVTLIQALLGLIIGLLLAFIFAIGMDRFPWVRRTLYPLLLLTQTIPTVAIAPILVLWLGYGMAPKIVLVVLTTLFPIAINLLNGFAHADPDAIQLLKLMGASENDILWHVKLPTALPYFFSGLKISVSYAFVGSVVAEWLGGFEGLGVYMIRMKNAFAYDHMFAVIVIISLISLLGLGLVSILERLAMPWQYRDAKVSS